MRNTQFMCPGEDANELLTIGRFSRASRLSLKALRLYDAQGLLPPAAVDDSSGYRYYSEDQLPDARLIAMLRQLDMPLERIAAVLEFEGAEAARAVNSYWREVEADTLVKRKLLSRVERHLRGEVEIAHRVEVRRVEEQKLISIQRHTLADELPSVIKEAGTRLIEHAANGGPGQAGPMIVIYHGLVTLDADGPVEVCVPVTGVVEPGVDIRVRLEPAHGEAYARISKAEVAFPDILGAYDSVQAWLQAEGKSFGEWSPREIYLSKWEGLDDEDPACDVAWPFDG